MQYKKNPQPYKDRERQRYLKNTEYIKNRTKKYYHENHEKMLLACKNHRNNVHFSGLRDIVLQRDNYKCDVCGSSSDLIVHHIDGNGRGSINPNNEMSNLITRCNSCHTILHHTGMKYVMKKDEDIV